jgi:hypothetical protein
MKSPSPETTLNNSLLEWLANTANNSQAPSVLAPPTTSPESRAEERKRLLMILNFAIALIDDTIFDFDPNDPNVPSASTTTSGQ